MARIAAPQRAALSRRTFRFFGDLSRHNRKAWMAANRERYQADVVAPLRGLVEALAPAVLSLHGGFETSARFGANLSRINRDIRFAKDKTPYRTRMYVSFSRAGISDGAELFVGIGDDVSVGFRSYGMSSGSALRAIGASRATDNPERLMGASRHLKRRYESYWYSAGKGAWTRHAGFPGKADDWERLKGLVVRKRLSPTAALRTSFIRDVAKTFEELFPLYRFAVMAD